MSGDVLRGTVDGADGRALDEHRVSRRRILEYGLGAAGAAALGGSLALPQRAGAAEVAKRGGTLKLAIGDAGSSDSLDPALSFTGIGVSSGSMIYDNLLYVDNDWVLHPMLAEDWSFNKKATVYSFKIRRGVEFHSGKTLTSADVAWQIRRLLAKKTGSGGLGLLSPVLAASGISTPDPRTIRFNLKAPDAFFGVKMGHYYTRVPQMGTTDWIKGSPGTGPFKNSRFKVGEGYELVRNRNYWQSALPYLDEVNCVVIAELSTKQEAVLTGDVDLSDAVPFSSVSTFQKSSRAGLFRIPGASPFTYDIDSSKKPYSDPRVSQALKMAIDRKKEMNLLVYGYGEVSADSLIGPRDAFYPKDLKPFPYDPDKAKSLLAAAGYSGGFKDQIWTTTAYPLLDDGATFAKAGWSQIGVDMDVKSVTSAEYLKAFLHQPIVMDYYLRQHPAITLDLYYASSSPQNTTRLKDAKIDGWIKEFKSTTNLQRQKALMSEILHRYNNVAAEIVPFHFDNLWPYKKRVRGLLPDPMSNINYRRLYLA